MKSFPTVWCHGRSDAEPKLVPLALRTVMGMRPYCPPSEFCQNRLSCFYVILLTNQQPANKKTKKEKRRRWNSIFLEKVLRKEKKIYICVLWHTSDTDQFRVNFVLLHNISSSRLKTSHGCKLNTHCMITVAPCELSRKEEIPTKRMDSYYKNNPSSLMTQEERVSIFSGLTVRLYCPYFLIILRDDLASHQIKASHQYFSPASSTWPYYKLQPTYPA